MYHLIKKDFLIQKKSLKLSLLLMLFFSVTFSTLGSNGLTVSILAISYMLVLGASALLVFGGSGITDNLAQNARMRFLSEMPDIGTMILIFIGLMVLMIVSYFLSLTFYRNREF